MPRRRPLTAAAPPALLAALALALAPAPSSGSGAVPLADTPSPTTSPTPRTLLLLDSSGSMAEPAGGGQTKIAAAREALTRVVRDLPDDVEVGLRVFGAEVFSRTDAGACEDTQLVVEPGTGNREELLAAVDDYRPFGETPIPAALRAAADDLGPEGSRTVVLVSDGESTCDPDPCQVAAELRERGIDLRIDVVGLSVSGAARDQLACIAERGGGTYYDADDAADVVATIDYVAGRAARPFAVEGEPVEGGTEQDPTPLEVGDRSTVLAPQGEPGGEVWFSLQRTVAGSTLRFSAVMGGTRQDSLHMEALAPDGSRCAATVVNRLVDAGDLVGGQLLMGTEQDAGTDDACAAPGTYLIRLERRLGDEGPVEVGLRVAEEPPVVDPGFAATPDEADTSPVRATGPVTDVEGARSFGSATRLGPGRWATTIVPGDASLFSVPLDFGQALRVQVDVPGVPGAGPLDGGLMEVALANPMRAQLALPGDPVASARAGSAEAARFRVATPPISRSLVEPDSVSGVEDWSTAGDHYVVLSMRPDPSETVLEELDVRIRVEVVGEPQPGPTWADGATWSVADGTAAPVVDEEVPEGAADEEAPADEPSGADGADGAGNGLVLMAVGVGIGLALLLAVVVAARRRGPLER